jgi:adenylylsulfate kinase
MNNASSFGFTCWLTGLSGAGKTTLSIAISEALNQLLVPHELLDGDVIRTNLSQGLGFSKQDRDINVLRVGYVCSLLNKHGINTVVALIAPYREVREQLKLSMPNFVEIFVDCPLEVCIERDPKGLYRKALSGEIAEFTGISSPYESPTNPDLVLRTAEESVEKLVETVLQYLSSKNLISNYDKR